VSFGRLWERVLRSAAFRSGYRLVPADDPRAHELPSWKGAHLELSALHAQQVQQGVDAAFVERLLPVLSAAARLHLPKAEARIPTDDPARGAPDTWPGGHYRLLAAFVEVFEPRTIVEIGTARGLSFLALTARARPDTRVVTYDVVPVQNLQGFLEPSDFAPPLREQRLGDLADERYFATQADVLKECDFLFMDGPKDGRFEYRFWDRLEQLGLKPGCLCVIDDVRLATMLRFWNELRHPRLDLISFGHHTGTGVLWWT
jgi:predicted O-methyltransferase YrrM